MALVVDANVLFRSIGSGSESNEIRQQFRTWAKDNESLHAPALLPFEIASALTRSVVAGLVDEQQIPKVLASIQAVPINLHPIADAERVVEIARQLKRQSAYDAAYLALAEQLSVRFYTLDKKLYNNASALGFDVMLLPLSTT